MISKEDLAKYIKAYREGQPLIPDELYDQYLEEYIKEHGESSRPFTRNKQSSDVNDIVGTLSKLFGVTIPMREGLPTYEQWINKKKFKEGTKILLQPKFDGTSIGTEGETYNCVTRGDFEIGESENVTDVFKEAALNHKKTMDKYKIKVLSFKSEGIMKHDTFVKFNTDGRYKTARDVVSGSITSHTSGNPIDLIPLRVYLENKRQYIPKPLVDISQILDYDDLEGIQDFIDNLLGNGALCKGYECDGVVASVVNKDEHGYYTIDEVAIKILDLKESSKLVNVEFQFGVTGRITPVAIFEPIMFGKRKVDHATLSTFQRVIDLGLRYGDTVNVMYNIVPYLMSSNNDGDLPIVLPTKCPYCHSEFDTSNIKRICCSNPQCIGRKMGNIIRYAEKMKIYGLSNKRIQLLYENCVIDSIESLYTMSQEDIENVPSFKTKSAKNILKAIKDSSEIELYRWLGAFPMNDVGSSIWKITLLATGITPQYLRERLAVGSPMDVVGKIMCTDIKGVGPSFLNKMTAGIVDNWESMKKTISYITFKESVIEDLPEPDKGRVTLTGIHKSEIINSIKMKGYEVGDFSVNLTKILVVPDDEFLIKNKNNKKVVAAKENDIPIITIDQIEEKL